MYTKDRNISHMSNGDAETVIFMQRREAERRAKYAEYYRNLEAREREWCKSYLDERHKRLMGGMDREEDFEHARRAYVDSERRTGLSVVEDNYEASDKWHDQFLNVMRSTGNIRASCHAVGIERRVALFWYAHDEKFAARWNEAMEDALDTLDAVAWKRAREGSDSLLRFLMERRRPELYSEKRELRIKADITPPRDIEETQEDPRISAQILQVLRDSGALDDHVEEEVDDALDNIIDVVPMEILE